MKFKTIRIDNLEGLEQAERLKNRGWVIRRSGLFTIDMSFGVSNKHYKSQKEG